jgi:hypothetical protein
MKLSAVQLRKIISEEISSSLKRRRSLQEGGTDTNMNGVVDAALSAFYDAVPPYDKNDPSMRANGETGWSEQVEGAAEDFRNELGVLLDKIMDKLYNGDYFI